MVILSLQMYKKNLFPYFFLSNFLISFNFISASTGVSVFISVLRISSLIC